MKSRRGKRPEISPERVKEFALIMDVADRQIRDMVKKFDYLNYPVRNLARAAYMKGIMDMATFLNQGEDNANP